MAKLNVMNSTIGLRPANAAPIPSPAKPCSVIGVSMTRRAPNSCSSPWLTLKAPWYSATSSPISRTLLSRRISSAIASRNASRTVCVTVFPVYSAGSGAGAGAGGCACAGARSRAAGGGAVGSSFSSGGSGGALAWGAADRGLASTSPTSSPFSAITAIGVLTATWSVPSGITIFASTPSSTASTSIVALSVSISASTSPARTGSPTFLTQRAILPSVIVGDSAGISTSLAIPSSASPADLCPPYAHRSGFGQHIRPQLAWIGLRAVLRELRRFCNDVAGAFFDLLQLVLPGTVLVEQALAQMVDRVVLGAHAVDFVLGTVLRRIGHRVAAIPVGQHFEDDRPLAGAGMLDGFDGRFVHRDDIHSVDLLARNAVGHAAVVEVGTGRGAADR